MIIRQHAETPPQGSDTKRDEPHLILRGSWAVKSQLAGTKRHDKQLKQKWPGCYYLYLSGAVPSNTW
jgi:hypothetical protein